MWRVGRGTIWVKPANHSPPDSNLVLCLVPGLSENLVYDFGWYDNYGWSYTGDVVKSDPPVWWSVLLEKPDEK